MEVQHPTNLSSLERLHLTPTFRAHSAAQRPHLSPRSSETLKRMQEVAYLGEPGHKPHSSPSLRERQHLGQHSLPLPLSASLHSNQLVASSAVLSLQPTFSEELPPSSSQQAHSSVRLSQAQDYLAKVNLLADFKPSRKLHREVFLGLNLQLKVGVSSVTSEGLLVGDCSASKPWEADNLPDRLLGYLDSPVEVSLASSLRHPLPLRNHNS